MVEGEFAASPTPVVRAGVAAEPGPEGAVAEGKENVSKPDQHQLKTPTPGKVASGECICGGGWGVLWAAKLARAVMPRGALEVRRMLRICKLCITIALH